MNEFLLIFQIPQRVWLLSHPFEKSDFLESQHWVPEHKGVATPDLIRQNQWKGFNAKGGALQGN